MSNAVTRRAFCLGFGASALCGGGAFAGRQTRRAQCSLAQANAAISDGAFDVTVQPLWGPDRT